MDIIEENRYRSVPITTLAQCAEGNKMDKNAQRDLVMLLISLEFNSKETEKNIRTRNQLVNDAISAGLISPEEMVFGTVIETPTTGSVWYTVASSVEEHDRVNDGAFYWGSFYHILTRKSGYTPVFKAWAEDPELHRAAFRRMLLVYEANKLAYEARMARAREPAPYTQDLGDWLGEKD